MERAINKTFSVTLCAAALLIIAPIARAQATQFTYQGRLTDGAAAASGQYDLQFQIFGVLSGSPALGTVQLEDVQITNGIFTVKLDFGATNFNNNGAQFLEIGIRPGNQTGAYTALTPRQQLTSTPYAIKSLNAATADGLSVACVNCVTSSQIQSVSGGLVSGTIPVLSVPAGSPSYVQNSTSPQATSNFNISGDGAANSFTAAAQYNVGLNRVLTVNGLNFTNTFVGVQAGNLNPSGNFNSFFGNGSGKSTTTGGNNSFYGSGSGLGNQSGSDNAFFGRNSGFGTTGSQNSFFGSFSGTASSNTGSGNSFFGYQSGQANTTGQANSYFGIGSGMANTTGILNSFLGQQAGASNTTGGGNTFIGANTGLSNTVESNNTFIGFGANGAADITNATAIGAAAFVAQSNSLVLGSVPGFNGASNADTNVGIGTIAPVSRLHLNGDASSFAVTLTNNANSQGRRGYRLAFDNNRFTFQRADDFGNFAANQVTIDQATGQVGIGTVSPDRTLTVNGTADKPGGGSWDVFSDERLKTIKGSFTPGLKALMRLQPVRYEYRPDNALGLRSTGEHIGFGAQAVQKIIPEAISQNDKGYLLVNNDPILWTMLNAIKEQQFTIEKLQQENSKLKARNADTETRLTSVEKSVRRMAQENRRHRLK